MKIKTELKNITINNNIDKELLLFADMNMVNAILRNLISNAIKFTKRGGTITLDAKKQGNEYYFCVEDNGIGIPDDIVNSLFSISSKVSRIGTDGEPSTGLGLILCKEYVDKHKGKIWVQSQENIGSKFCISIPSKK